MSLVPDYEDSSNSSDESSAYDEVERRDTEKESIPNANALQQKLPTPDFQVKSKPHDNGLETSVFKNPYLDAEYEKEAVLQKHVRMVDLSNTVLINGKKICWNYRKGRCRFGHNCRFAHDSDVQKTEEQIEAEKILLESTGVVVQKGQIGSTLFVNNEEKITINGKRKRHGLTQGLTPGKKVMKNYYSNKKMKEV